MLKNSAYKLIVIIIALSQLVLADKSPYDWAFIHLDGVRNEKVEQLKNFCDRIHSQAQQACADNAMIEFFDLNLKFRNAAAVKTPPPEIQRKIEELNGAFEEHYIRNWLSFYDILFVDMTGNVIYSIRKECDSNNSLFSDSALDSPLTKCIKTKPVTEQFVDFHYCGVSQEPASFFVEPVNKNGKQLGWVVLQLAINKINSLFSGTEVLGQTNEAIVVNRQGFMLTESNFVSDDSILKTRLDDCNIEPKFKEGSGNRIVTDYRGFTALTSFEVVEFLNTQWLVVVKMDESEITTEHYNQHQLYYNQQIADCLKETSTFPNQDSLSISDSKVIRQVDMDEFVRAKHNESLQTMGVSTCTAVLAMYPGKFGYMAHVSPLDKVYGGDATDLVGAITKKIKTYDIYKYERRHVKFVIIARHLNSLNEIIDKLVTEDFLLSQITVMYHPQAEYARVLYDYSNDDLRVSWVIDRVNGQRCIQDDKCSHNIGEIVNKCIKHQQQQYVKEYNNKITL